MAALDFRFRAMEALAAGIFSAASSWAAPGDDGWKAYQASDYAKARAVCQAPADAGDAACQDLIGNLFLNGQGVALNYGSAERYFRKAADQGNSGGEQALGWLYQNGFGVKKDLTLAFKWYKTSAEKGDRWGQAGLGWLYYNGWGVKQDYAEAAKWLRKSAEQGQADPQQGLAWLYYNGWGVKQDYAMAFMWSQKSADQGNQWGENILGTMYAYGLGVKKDDSEAARLWQLSADQGNPHGAQGLGSLLRQGRGVPRDYAKALKWLRFAFSHGELANSAANLGLMYENGEGLTQDYVEAYKWFLIGAAHDSPDARAGIERLKVQMTREQIAEAQKLAAASETSSHGQAAAEPIPPPAPAAPAPSLSSSIDKPSFTSPERPDDFALVVGVETYSMKDLPKATYAERDADAVSMHLLALGVPARNLRVLKGSEATAGKLRGYLESWLPRNVKPGSRVYFYFSGHGAPNPQAGGTYLLPWDGDPALLKETAEPLKDVYASLGKLKAAEVVVALDACFSGAGGRSVIQKGTRPLVTVREDKEPPPNLAVMTAAQGDETTGTLDAEGHGLFTYYLLEGLDRGRKSTRELCDYLKPKVADAAARENRSQTPTCRGLDAAFSRK